MGIAHCFKEEEHNISILVNISSTEHCFEACKREGKGKGRSSIQHA